MATATLTVNSKNYGAWSLRGWLLCKFSGIDFVEKLVPSDDPATRAELLLMSSSFRVPRLEHEGFVVWDTVAIGEYLHERFPESGLLPEDLGERTYCRSVVGEMHAGFANLRAGLPMNLRARFPGYPVWAGVQADIDRILEIWEVCLDRHDGGFLFGAQPTMADAFYAPVCTRFRTYDVALPDGAAAYCAKVLALPEIAEWEVAARLEPADVEELEVEF